MLAERLYDSILQGKTRIQDLNGEERSSLFGYLCTILEQGSEVDRELLNACASEIPAPDTANAEKIIRSTYKKLGFIRVNGRGILRRLLVAAITAVMAVVMCFGTASAFGIDIVEEFHIIITSEHTVTYEEYNPENGKTDTQRYVYSRLFQKELSGYVYPAVLPDTVSPARVTRRPERDGRVYTLFLEPSEGEHWQIFATPADQSYLPMGYKFSADYGDVTLDYVCTVMRSSDGITGYKLYTVYNGTQYTFYLYTDDWSQVKVILENIIIP